MVPACDGASFEWNSGKVANILYMLHDFREDTLEKLNAACHQAARIEICSSHSHLEFILVFFRKHLT